MSILRFYLLVVFVEFSVLFMKSFLNYPQVITFVPRYIIVNNTNLTLHLTQLVPDGHSRTLAIAPHGRLPFHWPHPEVHPKRMAVRLDGPDWVWSGPFSVNDVGDSHIKLRRNLPGKRTVGTAAAHSCRFVWFFLFLCSPSSYIPSTQYRDPLHSCHTHLISAVSTTNSCRKPF